MLLKKISLGNKLSPMQKIIAGSLLVTLFSHAITFNSSNNILPKNIWQQSWLSVTDSTENITAQYPSNWKLKHNTGNALFFFTSPLENPSDSFSENINLIVRNVTQGQKFDLKTSKEAIIQQINAERDSFKLVYSKDFKWNFEKGLEISYTFFDKSSKIYISIIQRLLYSRSRVFVCTYTSQGFKKDVYKSTAFAIMDKISW